MKHVVDVAVGNLDPKRHEGLLARKLAQIVQGLDAYPCLPYWRMRNAAPQSKGNNPGRGKNLAAAPSTTAAACFQSIQGARVGGGCAQNLRGSAGHSPIERLRARQSKVGCRRRQGGGAWARLAAAAQAIFRTAGAGIASRATCAAAQGYSRRYGLRS
jgi:hypothetical protein